MTILFQVGPFTCDSSYQLPLPQCRTDSRIVVRALWLWTSTCMRTRIIFVIVTPLLQDTDKVKRGENENKAQGTTRWRGGLADWRRARGRKEFYLDCHNLTLTRNHPHLRSLLSPIHRQRCAPWVCQVICKTLYHTLSCHHTYTHTLTFTHTHTQRHKHIHCQTHLLSDITRADVIIIQ